MSALQTCLSVIGLCHEGGPLADNLVTMVMAASTVLYSMSNMSAGGPILKNACGEGAWPLLYSSPSPTVSREVEKGASSERGGARLLPALEAAFSSFTSSDWMAGATPPSTPDGASISSPWTKPSPVSCNSEEEEEKDDDDEDASIFSSFGDMSKFPDGAGSGVGGSCSVPGSMSEDESRVSVSEVLVGVNASCWSGFTSLHGGRDEEQSDAGSPTLSSSLLIRRRLTGVAPSSSTEANTHAHWCNFIRSQTTNYIKKDFLLHLCFKYQNWVKNNISKSSN